MRNIKLKANKGFTLLEILIAISIVAILSSLILVGLTSIQARGRDTRRIKDLSETQHALEFYNSKNGVYPNASDWSGMRQALIADNPSIVIPNDPTTGRSYGYCHSGGSPDRYVIGAFLEDVNNPNLSQYPSDFTFPCNPAVAGTANPNCSKQGPGAVTNKYCLVF